MYYTVYKVKNKTNGKFYIGTHKTKKLDDNYMGSGKYLKHAIRKNGIKNFEKEILFIFDTPELMYEKEAEIVNEEFISEENTYNIKVGGFGGFDYINNSGANKYYRKNNQKVLDSIKKAGLVKLKKLKTDTEYQKEFSNKVSDGLKHYYKHNVHPWKNRNHTDETKKLIGSKNSENQKGTKNSNYGNMWIHSLLLKQNKLIKKNNLIPEGWIKGRKINF